MSRCDDQSWDRCGSHALAFSLLPLQKAGTFHARKHHTRISVPTKNITELLKLLLLKAYASSRKRVPALPGGIV